MSIVPRDENGYPIPGWDTIHDIIRCAGYYYDTDVLDWVADEGGAGGTPTASETYKISDMEDGGDPSYFGFLTGSGAWRIMRLTTAGAARYCKGSSGYAAAWSGRGSLTYDYYG